LLDELEEVLLEELLDELVDELLEELLEELAEELLEELVEELPEPLGALDFLLLPQADRVMSVKTKKTILAALRRCSANA
jgi:Mg/Co/Ni transporter MgtE